MKYNVHALAIADVTVKVEAGSQREAWVKAIGPAWRSAKEKWPAPAMKVLIVDVRESTRIKRARERATNAL